MSTAVDVATSALMLVGALLSLIAAIGLHRLGDVLSRMHAATKPATLGIVCCAGAATLQLADLSDVTKLAVAVVLQLVTAPVGAHMLARAVRGRPTLAADE